MGIYDGKSDPTLSDVYKRAFSKEPLVMQGDIEIPNEFLDRLNQEMALTDEIKSKILDICTYMCSHSLSAIECKADNGITFKITMETPKEAADEL